MKRLKLLVLILLSFVNFAQAEAPKLSPEAQISILTCGPGSELYSLFGHSAIRVKDPVKQIDVVFNYGTFSFDENFYFNFAMGRLNYRLSISNMEQFMYTYQVEERSVSEQILRLSPFQKQAIVDYLDWNHQPENREYLYDFFYDNCSSKLRDVLGAALPQSTIAYKDLQYPSKPSFRDMIDRYLIYHPWGDFGIDLGLGLPCDKIPSSDEYVFLPAQLERAFDQARLDGAPLVMRKTVLHEGKPLTEHWSIFQPIPLSWIIFGLMLTLSSIAYRRRQLWWGIDMVFFLVVGAVGALVFFLWFVTDHTATANNFNILWAWPTHLLAIGFLFFRPLRRAYMLAYGCVLILTLIAFAFLPQQLHLATIPFMLAGIVRAYVYYKLDRAE